MSDSKYSVLLMRDDAGVKRYRVSPAYLKLFVFLQIALILCAALGTYAGFSSWWDKRGMEGEKRELEQRLVEAELRLERLSNMEQIINNYDPAEVQALMQSMPVSSGGSERVDLAGLFSTEDTGSAMVSNIQTRASDNQITVGFDLSNQSANALAGKAHVAFVANDGTFVEAQTVSGDLSFRIQSFKRMRGVFDLPEGVSAGDVFGMRLEIRDADDTVIYAKTYPLDSLGS